MTSLTDKVYIKMIANYKGDKNVRDRLRIIGEDEK